MGPDGSDFISVSKVYNGCLTTFGNRFVQPSATVLGLFRGREVGSLKLRLLNRIRLKSFVSLSVQVGGQVFTRDKGYHLLTFLLFTV